MSPTSYQTAPPRNAANMKFMKVRMIGQAYFMFVVNKVVIITQFAEVVELVDTLAWGASERKLVRVQVPLSAPLDSLFLRNIVNKIFLNRLLYKRSFK